MFTKPFDTYVCGNDSIELTIEGLDIQARIEYDSYHIDDDDCHNIDQSVTGCDDAQQEKLLEARQAWQNDEWFYCGVVLSVYKNGVRLTDHAASLWGIEANYPSSNNAYLLEVANELLPEALEEGKKILKAYIGKTRN